MRGGFPDYYQFAHPTRIVAGRGMIEGTGFEFMKEGAKRPLIVTDQGIRATGPGREGRGRASPDGGLEVAGVFDEVEQDSSTDDRRGLRGGRQGGRRRLVPRASAAAR